jgi:uncharacterized protein DUF3305
MSSPLMRIPVSVVVERAKSTSQWIDYLWRPVAVLAGEPATAPWTRLTDDGERATFYAGRADVALYRTETGGYRDNLATGAPALWVVLRPTEADPPYDLFTVTADPSEGEGMTEAGNNIVEPVPMPEPIRAAIEAFILEHHQEQVFEKRKRDRADPDAMARRGPGQRGERR